MPREGARAVAGLVPVAFLVNRGQEVVGTDYWAIGAARRGLLLFSWCAGALRVLVPPGAMSVVEQMPPPGTPCRYVQDSLRVSVVYLDDPEHPYAIQVDPRQCDMLLPPGEHGREVRVLWYARDGEEGVRLIRDERAVVEIYTERLAPIDMGAPVLTSPSCTVEAFEVEPGTSPERIEPSPHVLLAVSGDPASEWIPSPSGPHSRVARAWRPPGTGTWHCLLSAASVGGSRRHVLVRVLWAGDSLAGALRGLEDTTWGRLPREFVVAALTAHRIGRTCRGAEGPATASVVPWSSPAPIKPPAALSRREVEKLSAECLDRLLRREAVAVPGRGTDAYRFLVELGSLVWQREHARRLAAAYAGEMEAPAVLVHAVGLHAMLRHPVEVEVSGVRIRAADLRSGTELWAQWCEWLRCEVPQGFLRWVHPDGAYRVSEMLEPRAGDVPDAGACRAVERALVEDAEQHACYVPYGAFVLEVPEELFLHRWGIRDLWLWVEGCRMWCAVDGGDGPRESFCWEAGRGVTNLVVSREVGLSVGAVLAAVWRDMVVAGEAATPGRTAAGGRARGTGPRVAPSPSPRVVDPALVFPRRRAVRLELSGVRSWGAEEDHLAVRRAHGVRGHLRRLWDQRRPSGHARAAAGEFGIVLPDGFTFVRPHVRGRGGGPAADGAPPPRRVLARGLATVAAVLARVEARRRGGSGEEG